MRTTVATFILMLMASSVLAQVQDADQTQVSFDDETETVVVTAARAEQRQFEAMRSVDIVNLDRIEERQTRAVPELIEEVPGVFLQQTNRGAGAPFIRGLVGPQNLILVDGIRFNTSTYRTGPNQYLALIHPFALDRIEVVRGPSSVLYGNGAMGGVMHAITRTPRPHPEAWRLAGRARAGVSTADLSHAGSVEATLSGHDVAVQAGFSTNNFGTLRAGGGVDQPLSDYHASYWHAKLVYDPGDAFSFTATYLGAGLRDAGRADQLGRGDVRFYDNDEHLAYVVLRYDGETFKRTRLAFSHQQLGEQVSRFRCRRTDEAGVEDPDACLLLDESTLLRKRLYDDVVKVFGMDASAGVDLLSGRLRLNLGIEYYDDKIRSTLDEANADTGFAFAPRDRGNFSDLSGYLSVGAFLHGDVVILDLGEETGELRLTGGVRYSHFGAEAASVPGIGDVDFTFDGVVGAAGVQWLRPGVYSVYFNWVQGFRAPNLQEVTVLGDTGDRFEVPNPDLGPELADTLELGTRLNLGPVQAAIAYYYTFYSDAITQQATTWAGQDTIEGKQVTRLVNGDEGVLQGLELSGRLTFGELSAVLSATWTQGDITTGEGTTGARRVPPVFGLAAVRYDHPEKTLYAELYVRWALRQDRLHPGDRSDVRICETGMHTGILADPCDGTPGWATLNLRLGWRPDESFRIDLQLANITDTHYRLHGSGYDMAGFDLRTTVTWNFR